MTMATCPTSCNGWFRFCVTEAIFDLIGDSTKEDDYKWAEIQTSTALYFDKENPRSVILLEFYYQNIQ